MVTRPYAQSTSQHTRITPHVHPLLMPCHIKPRLTKKGCQRDKTVLYGFTYNED
jgi:hypothetical protein